MAYAKLLPLATLAFFATVAGLSVAAQEPCAIRPAPEPFYDVAAVRICPADVVIATPKGPAAWRHRVLRVPPYGSPIADAALSRTGTKLAVLYWDGHHEVLDLTVSGHPTTQSTHDLPDEIYTLVGDNNVPLHLTDRNCPTAHPSPPVVPIQLPDGLAHALPSIELKEDNPLQPPAGHERQPCRWKFFPLSPNPFLYAPVLRFAPDEPVLPSETAILPILGFPPTQLTWQTGGEPQFRDPALRDAFTAYLSLPAETKRQLAAVYCRVTSFPGSWLFEFWAYYPFDVGGVDPHLHDTEHVFVEADKIAGRVVSVLGAAHTSITPNNLYLSGSTSATLPLSVLVERGKHGVAPDIDRDGRFTPGVDVSGFSESAQVWGVRDAIGQTDWHMRRYEASMTLDRRLSDAWVPKDFPRYFAGSIFSAVNNTYRLVAFPRRPLVEPVPDEFHLKHVLSKEIGDLLLNLHRDAQKSHSIYKPWVFPYHQVRVGFANIQGGGAVSVGYVGQLDSILALLRVKRALRIPVPGRLAIEALGTPLSGVEVNVKKFEGPGSTEGGQVSVSSLVPAGSIRASGIRMYYGAQYEGAFSNLFGYFGGYFKLRDILRYACPGAFCSPATFGPSNLYQFGVYLELPREPVFGLHNIVFHIGPGFSAPGGGSGVYFRLSTSVWRRRGRTTFGNPPAP